MHIRGLIPQNFAGLSDAVTIDSSSLLFQEGCLYVFGGVSRIDDQRTNTLQKIWLDIPTLKTLCWTVITDYVDPEYLVQNKQAAIQLGIPSYLLDLYLS